MYTSAFSKLDCVNATIRSSNGQVEINDAFIRFERATEVRVKSAGCVEEVSIVHISYHVLLILVQYGDLINQ